jgi:hypothetical protein
MGSWGTGLFDNDMTMDLRDDFRSVCRAPWDGEALLTWATDAYPMAADPTDDDHTDVRLALADLFWTYGIEHADTMGVARRIVADGTDVAKKRELGMGERDLARRSRLLARLATKWSVPNPTPRPRRIMTQGEAFTFHEGDCLVYPTSKGRLRNPYVSPAHEAEYDRIHPWSHDGWGAAIVLARRRQFDIFACHVIALLAASAPTKPDLGAFIGLRILHTEAPISLDQARSERPTRRRVQSITMSPAHRTRMRIEVLGRLPVRTDLVEQDIMPQVRRRHWDESLANAALFGAVGARLVDVDDPVARYIGQPA